MNTVAHFEIRNVKWQQDDLGWYWLADLYDVAKEKVVGMIGNFYETDERLDARPMDELLAATESFNG